MKILVTGSEGSLMSNVIPLLLEEGYDVVGVDNFARYGRQDRSRHYQFVEGDLTNQAFVDGIMRGIDGVVQGAATIYGVGGFHKRPATILSNDLVLHGNVLKAAAKSDVRRVAYISSSMVYERVNHTPTSEDDIDQFGIPLTDYGLSKLVGERMSRAFWSEFDLEYVIWRPFNIITPFEQAEGEIGTSHVFADFVDAIVVRQENPMPILGDGEQVRCFTWIGDVASGIATHSFSDATRNQVFNLGNPRSISMRVLAQMIFDRASARGILEAKGDLTFRSIPAFADDVRRRIPDVNKAMSMLGWQPSVQLEEALDRCLDELLAKREG